MTWCKSCEAQNAPDAKCPNWQQQRLMLCLKTLHQSLECWLRTSLCQKYRAKTILSKLITFSNLLNSTGKKLEWQEGVHGYLLCWLGTSLWHHNRTQIVSDWARVGDSKTHQRLAGTTQSGIPVILCKFWSNLWKYWSVKNLTVLWKLQAETSTVIAV